MMVHGCWWYDGYVGKAGGIVVTMIGNNVGKDGFDGGRATGNNRTASNQWYGSLVVDNTGNYC